MSVTRKLSTIICWQDDAGEDRETCAVIVYASYPGFAGDRTDPPEEPSIEIQNITVTSGDALDGRFWTDDEDLKAECLIDAAEQDEADRADAEEYRAEQRADDRMMEDWK